MKSASLCVFTIALGALLISHTSAAPTSGFPTLGKGLIKLLVSSNVLAEAETSDSVGNQVNTLIRMAFGGIQTFFDNVNEALAEEQQYSDVKVHINNIGGAMLGVIPTLASNLLEK
jgi:hypothetical protein